MKRLLITLLLTLTLLTASVSADAIDTVRGFNYINEGGLIFADNRPLYLGTGSGPSAGVYTADVKINPDGTGLTFTGAGTWNMAAMTGAISLPAATLTLTYGATVAANRSITYAAGSGGMDASLGTGTWKTSSGTNTHYGDTVITGSKNFTVGTGATVLGGTLDVDGNTDLDLVNVSETLDVTGAATFASTIDVTYAPTDVSGVNNAAMIISMQLIENASVVDVDYVLNDAVINETDNVYTVWENELTADVPRCLTADPDADYVGTITFYGTDINDAAISDTLTWSTGHAEMTTTKAFKGLTNITIGTRTGNGDTTVDIGIDGKLGLNTLLTDTSQILKASLDNADETIAASAVSSTVLSENVVEVTTALDGAKDVKVYMMV